MQYNPINLNWLNFTNWQNIFNNILILHNTIKKNSKIIDLITFYHTSVAQLVKFWISFLEVISSSFKNLRATRSLHGY